MKRYLAFMYSDYYPDGGWNDFVGSFSTIDEAFAFCDKAAQESLQKYYTAKNIQIIDTVTLQRINNPNV